MTNGWRHLRILLSFALLSPAYAQITNPEISNDQAYIYFKFKEKNPHRYYHVYIDSDNNADTGFSLKGIGADLLLENDTTWKSTGKSWGWTQLSSVSFNNTHGRLSWKIPLNLLGAPLQCKVPLKVIFSGEGRAHVDVFSPVINYTLNVGNDCGDTDINTVTASATATNFSFSYQVSAPQALYRIFLDTDGNTSNGYPVNDLGADYLLIGKSLYAYTNGDWVWLKSVAFTESNNRVTWTLKRSDLGKQDCAGSLNYIPTIQKNGGSMETGSKASLNYSANANCSTPILQDGVRSPAS